MSKMTLKFAILFVVAFGIPTTASSQGHPSAVLTITGTQTGSVAGRITITVNGQTEYVDFGQFSTANSIASAFGALFSSPLGTTAPPLCAAGICAKADGAKVVFQFEDPAASLSVSWVPSLGSGSPFGVDSSLWPGSGGQVPLPMSLNCLPSPVTYGSTITCMAGLAPGTNGTVAFTADGASWTSAAIDANGNAVASGGLSGAAQGSHIVGAQYAPSSAISSAYGTVEVVAAATVAPTLVYAYSITTSTANPLAPPTLATSGYDATGNVTAYSDLINGTWSQIKYDSLNRLVAAGQGPLGSATPTSYDCWAYDSFGNRTIQASSNSQPLAGSCQPSGTPTVYSVASMTYNDGTNRITGRSQTTLANTTPIATPVYDNGSNTTGEITGDQTFGYLYDARGKICAAHGADGWMGYIYDAEGARVAKVPLPSAPTSCDPNTNGILANVSMATLYVIGPHSETMTEVVGGTWTKTHVSANGIQVASYDGSGIHFHIQDWLGTRRIQTDAAGIPQDSCTNEPFGDQQTCSVPSSDVSDQHYTGKERDTESGLDYFGARYYGSNMGRFMSPDKPVDQHPEDPQSWNLYTYVRNNPLSSIDQDGNYDCGQMTADQCTQFGNNLTAAQNQLAAAQKNGSITDAQFKQGSDALGAYGTLNDHNGVTVNVGATGGFPGTTSVSNDGTVSAANPTGQNIQVTFNPGAFGGNSDALYGTIGHEGSHVEDGEAWAKAGFTDAANPTHFDTEFKAYGVTSIFGAAQGAGILRGTKPGDNTPHLIWERNFPDVVNNALRTNMIKTLYPNWAEKAFQANTNPEKK
jgi:RHS repeat-associated protein